MRRNVHIGSLGIGPSYPVRVESMLKTPLSMGRELWLREIEDLAAAGCELVRVAFPDMALGEQLVSLVDDSCIPVMADIHFNFALAMASIEAGCPAIRINPGNMGSPDKLQNFAAFARKHGVVVRVGSNSGSIPESKIREADMDEAAALADSVGRQVRLLQETGLEDIIISAKSTSPRVTARANEFLARDYDYPIHIGITESGYGERGIVKSACGLALLLGKGIGDTIRVSLTDPSINEVRIGRLILQSLGIRRSYPELVSCPGCGRRRVDVQDLVRLIEPALATLPVDLTVAVMGCEVNGPGEAAHADIGVAGTATGAVVFSRGKVLQRCSLEDIGQTVTTVFESLAEEIP